ncbi:DUF86 domain-containing protein [Archaeoglobus sp.]|uniref:type VII toxin-antitoxin system HepT family RNase toxin n=1 Tax=Archaeoglobus sp. TaxID=1872626 RepID=UPI0025C560CC|nr:DUF86 domain-containing protein [Archaeoglobus sp.]
MEYDEEKITKLSSELFNALRMLRELSELPKDEFLSNPHYVASAKYFLIVAIEAATDICNHIISRNKLRVPEDYADTFRVMKEAGFFDDEFAERLMRMARFRNRLVHIYWNVDDELIYEILQGDIEDLEEFIDRLMGNLRKL